MEKELEAIKSLDDKLLIELYSLVEEHLEYLKASYIEEIEQEEESNGS